jgi:hypothetical protein
VLRAPCLHTLSPHFVGYASSSHLVPTLCRTRQVKLTRRHEAAKSFNRRCPASQAHVRRFAQNIFVGRAVPVTPLRGVTGEPHIGHCNANPAHSATYPPLRELHQSGADIPVCARTRGQTGMSAPHYHTPALRLAGTASPHLRLRAFARASPALDEFKRGFGVGASRLHLVSHTLSPHLVSTLCLFTLRPHTSPLRFVKSCSSRRTRRSGPTRMPWAGRMIRIRFARFYRIIRFHRSLRWLVPRCCPRPSARLRGHFQS